MCLSFDSGKFRWWAQISLLSRRLWHYWVGIVLGEEEIFIIHFWETAYIVSHVSDPYFCLLHHIFDCMVYFGWYNSIQLKKKDQLDTKEWQNSANWFSRNLYVSHTFFALEDNVDILLLNVVDLSQSDLLERRYINIQTLYVICHRLLLGVQCETKWWNIYSTIWYMCVFCGIAMNCSVPFYCYVGCLKLLVVIQTIIHLTFYAEFYLNINQFDCWCFHIHVNNVLCGRYEMLVVLSVILRFIDTECP